MKNINIRRAEYKDIPELVDIRLEALSITKTQSGLLENNIYSYFEEHLNVDLDVYIAENENGIIAIFCLSILTLLPRIVSENNKSAYLSFFYIKCKYDSQSLRKQLFKTVIDCAINRQTEVFELGAPQNKIHIYKRYKFEESEFVALHLALKDVKWSRWINDENKINIRKATVQDISVLVDMRTQFLNEVSQKANADIEKKFKLSLTQFLEQHLNNDVEAFVAELNGKIVSVSFTIYFDLIPSLDLMNGKMGLPVNNYTLPKYRGKNIGKALFAFSGEYAQMCGTELFEMEIPKACVALYKEFGFEPNEVIPMQLRL